MKKTLLITLATGAMAASALAQGTVAFQANAANGFVSYSLNGTTSVSAPTPAAGGVPGFGNANIGFFAAPDGTAVTLGANGLPTFSGAWTVAGSVLGISPTAGKTAATSFTLPAGAGAAGANVEMEIVGWTGTATSWADALAQGTDLYGFTGEIFNGSALGKMGWSQGTGNPNATPLPILPVNIVTGAGGYQGLVLQGNSITPEPTTIALGGLGAAALLLFRRRK